VGTAVLIAGVIAIPYPGPGWQKKYRKKTKTEYKSHIDQEQKKENNI